MSSNDRKIYSQEVIDMLTVGVQFCILMEHVDEMEKNELIAKLLSLLPMLYFKTLMIDYVETDEDVYLQPFVTENDYNAVAASVANVMGADDSYLEVFMDEMKYSDTPITAFISENLADIYQEIKDLAANYQSGNESVMSDALDATLRSFRTHWGQKLVNVLRALHICWINGLNSDGNDLFGEF